MRLEYHRGEFHRTLGKIGTSLQDWQDFPLFSYVPVWVADFDSLVDTILKFVVGSNLCPNFSFTDSNHFDFALYNLVCTLCRRRSRTRCSLEGRVANLSKWGKSGRNHEPHGLAPSASSHASPPLRLCAGRACPSSLGSWAGVAPGKLVLSSDVVSTLRLSKTIGLHCCAHLHFCLNQSFSRHCNKALGF